MEDWAIYIVQDGQSHIGKTLHRKTKHPGSAATSQGCKYLGNNKFPYCSVNFDLGF